MILWLETIYGLITQLWGYTPISLTDFHRECDAPVVDAVAVVWKLLD